MKFRGHIERAGILVQLVRAVPADEMKEDRSSIIR